MRSVCSTFYRITLSPHEYIASADNVSCRDIVSIETPSCKSEILTKGFWKWGCTASALPFPLSAWEVLLLIVVCHWVLEKLCLET